MSATLWGFERFILLSWRRFGRSQSFVSVAHSVEPGPPQPTKWAAPVSRDGLSHDAWALEQIDSVFRLGPAFNIEGLTVPYFQILAWRRVMWDFRVSLLD